MAPMSVQRMQKLKRKQKLSRYVFSILGHYWTLDISTRLAVWQCLLTITPHFLSNFVRQPGVIVSITDPYIADMKDLCPHPSAFRRQSSELHRWAMSSFTNDPVFVKAVCCLAAQNFQVTTHRASNPMVPDFSSSDIQRLILDFKCQAIFNLKRRLKETINENEASSTLYSVMALMAVEVCLALHLRLT